ncbi:unnamed protein product [Calicophoron daubneyi]|uniref:Uncharacterized protein n=1 Tax=Calicophoron daubneyi TaxID=300641 RepID=A0AAV2TU34_CALDB
MHSNPSINCTELVTQLHIDGMQLLNSSKACIQPILCRLVDPIVTTRFVLDVYADSEKYAKVEYPTELVEEVKDLMRTAALMTGSSCSKGVRIANFVCDTSARSFVGCKEHHEGVSSDKYTQRGTFEERKVNFPWTNLLVGEDGACPIRDAAPSQF